MSVTDGLITIRGDHVQGADLSGMSMGRPSGGPTSAGPAGWILADDEKAGWVGYGTDQGWLEAGEVHVRYAVLRRDRDLARRAIALLLHHLATRTTFLTAVLVVPENDDDAAAVAPAAGFTFRGNVQGGSVFSRPVPPLTYADGVVTIRRQRVGDIDQHLAAIDDQQIDWLWEPGDREKWAALTPAQQLARNLEHLRACHDSFGAGPKWTFSVDSLDATYVAYVDCDLANNHVPPGEANIAYTAHPAHRGRGYVSRAVRLIMQFLGDHTGAQTAHIIVDARNTTSLRVARAVAATESERWQDEHGRTLIRHVARLR
jgi:RimJ/RimL family protein N-acetyltransferase